LARQKEQEYRNAQANIRPQSIPDHKTFAEWVSVVLADRAKRSEGTQRSLESHLNAAAIRFGGFALADLNRETLIFYRNELYPPPPATGLSKKTTDDRMHAILQVLIYAHKVRRLAEVPKIERLLEGHENAPDVPPVSAADIDAVCNLIRDKYQMPGLAAFVEARAICGLRSAALGSLEWKHLNEAGEEALIQVPAGSMKMKLEYVLPIVGDLVGVIERCKLERRTDSNLIFHHEGRSLLASERKGGMSNHALAVWRKATAEAGIRGLEIAQLRHVASDRMIRGGASDIAVGQVMAHSSGVRGRYRTSGYDAAKTAILAGCEIAAQERAKRRKIVAFKTESA